jgi:hypothetical protein
MAWDDDMSLTPQKVSRARRVALRLARRLRTPRGHCLGHPNDGLDVSDRLQSTMTNQEASDLRADVHAEVLKDPCVTTAFVSVTLDPRTGKSSLVVQAFGAFGKTTVTFITGADGTLETVIT